MAPVALVAEDDHDEPGAPLVAGVDAAEGKNFWCVGQRLTRAGARKRRRHNKTVTPRKAIQADLY